MAALLVLSAGILLMKAVGLIVLSLVDRPSGVLPRHSGPAVPRKLPPAAASDPEQALWERLRTGRTTRAEYRAAMAALAADEARLRPWRASVTPDS